MANIKTTFSCQNCGSQSPKWIGKCPSCNEWNTYVEEVIEKKNTSHIPAWARESSEENVPIAIQDISTEETPRLKVPGKELHRVLGGGLVPGSITLLGGEPGIGKSTLLLQLALRFSNLKTLYVSGEESLGQIKMRAERIGISTEKCFIISETSLQQVFKQCKGLEPQLLVIDSIQTLHSTDIESTAGSVSQVKECTSQLMHYAKRTNTPVLLVGHITKDGVIAGPKVLEHIVDTVLQFEGDRNNRYRILRSIKNRFGSTAEIGIYEMAGSGLREVDNPSDILISQREEPISGITIGSTIEGNRPLMIELQTLVCNPAYPTPQRSTTGFDNKRLNMIVAVMEKRTGLKLNTQDIFLNIAGGLKVSDPSLDLGVAVALASSFEEIPVPEKICFAGEIGLGGEVRAVQKIDIRIAEAEKLGFKQIFISKFNKIDNTYKIRITPVTKLQEVYKALFG